ncbi:MAG: hypothetical protein E4G96_00845 [Chrysiogenales bacterium]|nr:MAG: hypothetical protein E4G96_00845 [Chrysiogenales bacterium]
MNDAVRIQNILDRIDPDKKNSTGPVFLNSIHNEFIMLGGMLTVPRIPVRELDYGTATGVVTQLVALIPEFLRGHYLLERRKPAADQHSLQFIRIIGGRALQFVHMLKIDLLFSGDSSTIIEKATTDLYPSYHTDRIYYKSKIIPVRNASSVGFEPISMKEADHVEADHYRHLFAIFDEHNAKDFSKELCRYLGTELFGVSLDLYQFIEYEYFTACMSILNPTEEMLEEACELFEPMFVILYNRYADLDDLIPRDSIKEIFSRELVVDRKVVSGSPEYMDRLKCYFQRFQVRRDEEMRIRGWWRIDLER